jgi:hypothetical protein
MTAISVMLDATSAATLQAALNPLAVKLPDDERTAVQRCADGITELADFMRVSDRTGRHTAGSHLTATAKCRVAGYLCDSQCYVSVFAW